MSEPDSAQSNPTTAPTVVALEHLTGRKRGLINWLSGGAVEIEVHDGSRVMIGEATGDTDRPEIVARLHRSSASYEIETLEGHGVWINGERAQSKLLESGDLIELDEGGPLLRYRMHRDGTRGRISVAEIFADCIDSARASRRSIPARALDLLTDMSRDVVTRTTLLFRGTMLVGLAIVALYTFSVSRTSVELERQIASEASRLESFAGTLARTQSEALRSRDLDEVRAEFGARFTRATERLTELEALRGAAARIIETASRSILFLQGSYGFRNPESGAVLRYVVNEDGNRLVFPNGQPLLSTEGEGPLAERQFTGTAFVVSKDGLLLTNRHVALPWEDDANLDALAEQGLEPMIVRFVGYLPGVEDPFDVSLLMASDEADLAVMVCSGVTEGIPSLELAEGVPRAGDEVIVLGYPTGLKAMLAQTGDAFVDSLKEDDEVDFWAVAQRLSAGSYIKPLASRGIVGQVAGSTIAYDAETTHGGSGGPVLDANGAVVAVNTAILPEYGGSNLGVPVSYVVSLLAAAGVSR